MSNKFFETLQTLERLDGLIRRKATGKPGALAQRLGISERQVYKLVSALRELGAPVVYCNKRETYYYTQEVEFRRELFVLKDDADKIKGGETFLEKVGSLQDFCSGEE
ncbi:MAG: HTH domain-containing protein [Haliscomenobacter sp.]|nr:HTH domain-containing protein [Haliscomenobacter sp.]MBK8656169.1 HTH domain-containing protein [Haliscomenobacter sp.]